jgi:hypothetical protein
MLSAVLTADIINSTRLSKPAERRLMTAIESILRPHPYSFYRGDSFQVFIKEASRALRIALLLRCAALRIEQGADSFDVRISIGIGRVKQPVKDPASAKGETFILSGRTFDKMDSSAKLMIVSEHNLLNIALEILSEYTDELFEKLTSKKAAIIFELLSGANQQAAAKRLKKSQSTINEHLHASRWQRIESILNKFERIIKLLSP